MSKITKIEIPLPFRRGVNLPSLKEPAASRPIIDITSPPQLVVPLLAGDGSNCQLAVKLYETVLRGNVLGLPAKKGGCSVFSPVTGVVSALQNILHPLLGNVNCAVIDCLVSGGEYRKEKPVESLDGKTILELAIYSGIVDELDGELLANKLKAMSKAHGVLLVADGSEQEPYSSAAWSVLNESAVQVRDGLELAAKAVGAEDFHIAVKLPKNHIVKLEKKLDKGQLYAVRGKYPSETAPQLIERPVCRIGVQACLALYRAAAYNESPGDCVITVAGDAVANPQNVRVPFGTMIEDILHFCGLAEEPGYVIMGDTMTGITIQHTDVPIVPGITCLIALKTRSQPPTKNCIGCGRCVQACHSGLLPYEIMRRLVNMQYERLASLLPGECDGCGACSYVCPAGLDITAKVLEARDAQGNFFMKWGDIDDL